MGWEDERKKEREGRREDDKGKRRRRGDEKGKERGKGWKRGKGEKGEKGQKGKKGKSLTNADPRVRGTPLNIPRGLDAGVEPRVGKDAPVGCVPGAAEGAAARHGGGNAGVCCRDDAAVHVGAVVVRKRRVCAFPRRDAAAAAAQLQLRVLDPERAEAVEEVCFAGYCACGYVGRG